MKASRLMIHSFNIKLRKYLQKYTMLIQYTMIRKVVPDGHLSKHFSRRFFVVFLLSVFGQLYRGILFLVLGTYYIKLITHLAKRTLFTSELAQSEPQKINSLLYKGIVLSELLSIEALFLPRRFDVQQKGV